MAREAQKEWERRVACWKRSGLMAKEFAARGRAEGVDTIILALAARTDAGKW
jgi:hypothetical protein